MISTFYLFLFNHDQWEYIHSNCSTKNTTEWYQEGIANVPIGLLFTITGVVCEIIYIPLLLAMLKPEFIQHSCYKIMFELGVLDMFHLINIGILPGVQNCTGIHFCMNPALLFITGELSSIGWYSSSFVCIILAINRFFEMTWQRGAEVLFRGKIMTFWLSLPFVYILFVLSQPTGIYSTKEFSYNSDPFAGTKGLAGMQWFNSPFNIIHNYTLSISLIVIYSMMCIIVAVQYKFINNFEVTKMQRIMTLQSFCICFEITVATIVYFMPMPDYVSVINHMTWILIHGDTPIVYLFLNKSLRNEVFNILGIRRFATQVVVLRSNSTNPPN